MSIVANDWKELFSEFPILQASLICRDITTNLDGQKTFHHELHKISQKGMDQFILVNIWRGKNTSEQRFYETIDLIGPDGENLSTTKSPPFHMFGPSYRHYNYFAYTKFIFPKKGTYELQSSLYKESSKEPPFKNDNFFIVV